MTQVCGFQFQFRFQCLPVKSRSTEKIFPLNVPVMLPWPSGKKGCIVRDADWQNELLLTRHMRTV